MSSAQIPGGLALLEAAYQTLGQLISVLDPTAIQRVVAPPPPAEVPAPCKLKCRNYIKYPAPQGLRPRALTPFRVADLCTAYNFPTGLAGGGTIGILESEAAITNPTSTCSRSSTGSRGSSRPTCP